MTENQGKSANLLSEVEELVLEFKEIGSRLDRDGDDSIMLALIEAMFDNLRKQAGFKNNICSSLQALTDEEHFRSLYTVTLNELVATHPTSEDFDDLFGRISERLKHDVPQARASEIKEFIEQLRSLSYFAAHN